MATAKQEILSRIRTAQKLSHTPKSVDIPREYHTTGAITGDELVELFIERVEDYKADVYSTTQDKAPALIAKIASDRGCEHVTYAPGLENELVAKVKGAVADKGDDPRTLDSTDSVITDSHVSCAETGTILLESNESNGRRALTLVPDRHICIVREETIVHRVPEMIARINPTRPATMISGPSATSDIELTRVEGVHGPRDLIVVVIRSA